MTASHDPMGNIVAYWIFWAVVLAQAVGMAAPFEPAGFAPNAVVGTKDGKTLFITGALSQSILRLNTEANKVTGSMPLPSPGSGMALSADERQLFVVCASPESQICIIDVKTWTLLGSISAGHTSMAPVQSLDGKKLYVCNRFNNDVSVIDLASQKELRRIAVEREPVAAALTQDGEFLLVANHLQNGRADTEYVAASVSVIDLANEKVVRQIKLPNGSCILKGICVAAQGQFAVLTHIVSRFNQPATDVYGGWITANAITVIDLHAQNIRGTVLLDEPELGAANPWGVAWSPNYDKLLVTHAGTHEISIIDFPAFIAALPPVPEWLQGDNARKASQQDSFLPFLTGARHRFKLPQADLGPRAITIISGMAYVANYFSDTLTQVDLRSAKVKAESISLSKTSGETGNKPIKPESKSAAEPVTNTVTGSVRQSVLASMSLVRRGEFYFDDATICYQQWLSCSSCHPGEARMDGLNWDLLNDGLENPKNTKSLLLAHQTPPAMSLGVRETSSTAVRAGIRHILFTQQPEEVANAIDEYLKSLKPVPSPHLGDGHLTETAKRGQQVFTRAGCVRCHPPGVFTNGRSYNVGTQGKHDKPGEEFDTPTLVELWRTAPYLHDGSATNLQELLTIRNRENQHGYTSELGPAEIEALCAYLLSL